MQRQLQVQEDIKFRKRLEQIEKKSLFPIGLEVLTKIILSKLQMHIRLAIYKLKLNKGKNTHLDLEENYK